MRATILIIGILVVLVAIGWQATLVTNASRTCIHCGLVRHKVTKMLILNREWIDNNNGLSWCLTHLPKESEHKWVLNGINEHRFGKLMICGIGRGDDYGDLFRDIDWCGKNKFESEAMEAWVQAQDSSSSIPKIRSALEKSHENIGE